MKLATLRCALALIASLVSSGALGDDVPNEVAAAVATASKTQAGLDLAPEVRSVAERIEEVKRRVQAAAHYPAAAQKRGVEGETLVSFEIASNGTPQRKQTVRSSGSLLLDRAALAAVEQAAPLPWIYGRVAVPVRFILRDAD